MACSERFLAGFALAATVSRDRGAQHAREGLHGTVAEVWTRSARELADLPKQARRAAVSAWMQPEVCVWPATPPAPLLAWALIAQRAQAPAPPWFQAEARECSLPRAGYTPEPELVALLMRLVTRSERTRRTGMDTNAAAEATNMTDTSDTPHAMGAREPSTR